MVTLSLGIQIISWLIKDKLSQYTYPASSCSDPSTASPNWCRYIKFTFKSEDITFDWRIWIKLSAATRRQQEWEAIQLILCCCSPSPLGITIIYVIALGCFLTKHCNLQALLNGGYFYTVNKSLPKVKCIQANAFYLLLSLFYHCYPF